MRSSRDSFREKKVCFFEAPTGDFLGDVLKKGAEAVGKVAGAAQGKEGEVKGPADIVGQITKAPVQTAADALGKLKLEAGGLQGCFGDLSPDRLADITNVLNDLATKIPGMNPGKILDIAKTSGIKPEELGKIMTGLPDVLAGVRTGPIADAGLAAGMIKILDALLPNRIDNVLAMVLKYVPPEMTKQVILLVLPLIPENMLRDAVKDAIKTMSKEELFELAKGTISVKIPILGIDVTPVATGIASAIFSEETIRRLAQSQVDGMSEEELRKKATEAIDKMSPDQIRSVAVNGGNSIYMSLRKKLISQTTPQATV